MRLALIIGVTAGVAIALVLIMSRAGGEGDALLYGGLNPQDAGAVAQKLDGANIEYRLENGGASIFVSRDEVASARLLVAQDGALGSGSVGYEIFDETDALGATQFIQNINAKRATEGELARTILSLRGVTSSRVHLVTPERRLFERESQDPTATVVIGLTDPSSGAAQASTIRNLVATAVPGLQPSRVTVIDETGRTLANGAEGGDEFGAMAVADQRAGLEERLRQKAMDAIEPIAGAGAVRVQVAAQLNMNRVTENAEIFDPDGQVVLSTQTVEDSSQDQEMDGQQGVSVANNLPGQPTGNADTTASSSNQRSEETVNYENSRTTRTEVREAGAIERLSIAVAVDEVRIVGEDGQITFEPRSEEDIARIAALARAAVGFQESRGDVLEITSLPFQHINPNLGTEGVKAGMFSFSKNDIMRVAEIGVLLIIGLALIFMVARPLAKGLTAPVGALAGAGGQGALGAPQTAALSDQSGSQKALTGPADDEDYGGKIDVHKVDGKLKANTVKQLTEIVEGHPEESLSILRTWMNEA